MAQPAEQTRVVVVGPEYQAGDGKRFWLGSGYRDLWVTPVRLPILDLATEAGGLTPVRQVGQNQSVGLALTGADGRSYTFRSLHKEADRMLPEVMRGTIVGSVLRDLTSGTHPAAGVILPVLAEAAGVPHTTPRLVVMPDSPALGAFAKTFANLVGTIEEFPQPASANRPGFMGATAIVSSPEMWQRWMQGPTNTLDSRAYLRARVLDLWIDNYDRHRGQWRWMQRPGSDLWQPLPEDPDFVLVHRDGLVARSIRSQVPQYLMFSDHFPKRLDGALLNSAEMDRWVLSGLSAADFTQIAKEVQARVTDDVIERAMRGMPPEWFAINGATSADALRKRRAGLVDYLHRVFLYYAAVVDIQATDRAEHVTIARAADGTVEITVATADSSAAPYYRRHFLPSETNEVRIFLRGGDDHVIRSGPRGGPITVRVVAGGGEDRVDDSNSGGTDVWRDAGTVDVQRGPGTQVRTDAWVNPVPVKDAPWIEPRSFGAWTIPSPVVGFAPDVLLYLGYGFTRTTWGFRTEPAKSVQSLSGAVATGTRTGRLEYEGIFRRPASGRGYQLSASASGLERYNYFGLGNERPDTSRARYKTGQEIYRLAPAFRYEVGRRAEVHVGPDFRYSHTPVDTDTVLSAERPLGVGGFGRVALGGGVAYDSRQAAVVAAKADYRDVSFASGEAFHATGVRFQANGSVTPATWSVPSAYGSVDGMVALYAGTPRAHLALRVGGQTLRGDYPWFDAAHIGGDNDRGYRSHRFTGDSSLYGGVSVRGWLGEMSSSFIALRLGVVGFGDVGRVWVRGESSRAWHPSAGGGLLAQPVGTPFVVHAIAARGDEGVRIYLGVGYPF